jgi:hypothetical protein
MDDLQKAWETVRLDAERSEEDAGTGSATGAFRAAAGDVAPVQPLTPSVVAKPAAAELVRPVVHRVVVGGDASGKASDYDELLNRLRGGSAAPVERKSPEVAAVPAAGSGMMGGAASGSVAPEPLVEAPPTEMRPIAVQTIDLRSPDAGFPPLERNAPVEKAQELTAEPAAAPSVGGFTALLRAGSGEALDFVRPSVEPQVVRDAPAASSPGSFTQMFQALDGKTEKAPVASGGGFAPQDSAPASSPGSFTQMFRALDAKAEDAPVASGHAPVSAPPAAPSESSPGSFTQLFRTLDSGGSAPASAAPAARVELPSAAPARRDEGSFTQMIAAQRPQDTPSYSAPREPQRVVPSHEGFGEARLAEPRPEPSGGGLTQLLRTLDGPASAPARRDEMPVSAPAAAGPGMFTQTYQALDGREQGTAAPAPLPPASAPFATGFNPVAHAPVVSGGPSEFTRILDASRMREMGLRGAPEAGISPAAGAAPQMSMPPLPPAPVMPQMPAGFVLPPAAPQMAPPAMPAVQPPQVAPPPAGMQKHLPMILIAVIFVLVVVVIALIFLMKR